MGNLQMLLGGRFRSQDRSVFRNLTGSRVVRLWCTPLLCILSVGDGFTASIRGVVTELATASPLSVGAVTLVRTDDRDISLKSAKLAPDGHYLLSRVSPGAYEIICRVDGFAVAFEEVAILTHHDQVWIDFALMKAAIIQGTVVFPGGVPTAGARIEVVYLSAREPALEFADHGESLTDSAGQFHLAVRPDGLFKIQVWFGEQLLYESKTLSLSDSQDISGIQLTIPWTPR